MLRLILNHLSPQYLIFHFLHPHTSQNLSSWLLHLELCLFMQVCVYVHLCVCLFSCLLFSLLRCELMCTLVTIWVCVMKDELAYHTFALCGEVVADVATHHLPSAPRLVSYSDVVCYTTTTNTFPLLFCLSEWPLPR